ncbi:MAG: MraY family glycosyltransferase [Bacteroidales bacterium]|jgi:UDP-N-acetylmuramyl pentapeptide phosphotransferase/UDP-N-acetylglucosamine-1-phosphate transferase
MDFTLNTIIGKIPEWVQAFSIFLLAFIITHISIPPIVKIARHKGVFDTPNERTSHNNEIPILGGIAIFAGLSVSLIICAWLLNNISIIYIIGGIIVIFLVGLKDDVFILDPWKKFIGQIIASSFVILLGNIRLTNFYGCFGLAELSYIPSILFTLFLFLTLINGFNLIDGVDGLASGTGLFSGLSLFIWFIINGNSAFSFVSISLIGVLLSYFIYNVFGKVNKIFMGDTGAMITGLMISVNIVEFLEFNKSQQLRFSIDSAPAVAISLVMLPLFDTLRVFVIRILNGKSPFKADKQHIHHLLLSLGLSHIKVTAILLSFNALLLLIVYICRSVNCIILIFLEFLIALISSLLLTLVVARKNHQ